MSKGQNEIRSVCGSTVLLMYPDIYTATFKQPQMGLFNPCICKHFISCSAIHIKSLRDYSMFYFLAA